MWDPRLPALLARGVYLGTSSWKYPGWRGFFYQRHYSSEKSFQANCLAEYALRFPAVGVDHTYYAWPNAATFEKYWEQTPEAFRFCLKATEHVTVVRYPALKRYGKLAGQTNPDFLNATVFRDKFLEPLAPFRPRLAPIVLEFSQFRPEHFARGSEFVERLDRFFADLGKDTGFSFAVELRNANWLRPPYFEMLQNHGVGHVYNSWTRMPSLREQLSATSAYRFPFLVSRILLTPGVAYQDAVEAFSPYDKLCRVAPELREDGAAVLARALEEKIPAYVFVNNRAEGCSPRTIEGILDRLPQQNEFRPKTNLHEG